MHEHVSIISYFYTNVKRVVKSWVKLIEISAFAFFRIPKKNKNLNLIFCTSQTVIINYQLSYLRRINARPRTMIPKNIPGSGAVVIDFGLLVAVAVL